MQGRPHPNLEGRKRKNTLFAARQAGNLNAKTSVVNPDLELFLDQEIFVLDPEKMIEHI